VNILILGKDEIGLPLPRSDRRWAHVKKVLRKAPGDRLAAGIACEAGDDGEDALGEAVVLALDDRELVLDYEPHEGRAGRPADLAPVRLILGFPRPIQAARILKDLTSLGVSEILLTGTELGEKSYLDSELFRNKDFRRPLLEGAEQAGNPRLPSASTHWTLARCLDAIGAAEGSRLYLHPYGDVPRLGAACHLGAAGGLRPPVTLAVGSERGWTDAETAMLERAGFEGRGLGGRILKSETAALAAVTLTLAALGRM